MQFKKDHFDVRCEIYFEKPPGKLFVVEIIPKQAHLMKKMFEVSNILLYLCRIRVRSYSATYLMKVFSLYP